MALRDELLTPIAGDNPGGADLRYDPLFDKVKEARREDDDAPQGEWQTERKLADWPTVIKVAKEALATKSKDLQLAAWLTEALSRREGFAGMHDGLDLLVGLVENFWDNLYPEIDEGDAEMRAAPLQWIGGRLELASRLVPLDRSGYNLLQQKESRTVPTEADAAGSTERGEARAAAIAAGKATPEQIEDAFNATTKVWYRTLLADVQASTASLKALDKISTDKFGDVSPSFGRLIDALDEVARGINQQVKRKLETDPDPIGEVAADAGGESSDGSAVASSAGGGQSLTAEPTSPNDAGARITGAARYLRREMPLNPAPYLLLRGYRWGELRASAPLDPRLLEAPPTNIRSNLKGMLLDGRWPELLEGCEMVMGTPHGRGWLDLQRYVLTACDALGSDYDAIATAIRGALRSLLTDLPQLVEMTLMDDTSTANAETHAWIQSTILTAPTPASGAAAGEGGEEAPAEPAPRYEVESRVRDPIALANNHARAGRSERAIELLMRESSREKSRRGRFVLQSHLARIMVDAGHDVVAMPILEELIADIEGFRLEEWEAGELVATPMTLLCRCLEKTGGDESVRQSLYLRVCRLDPIQAIGLGPR